VEKALGVIHKKVGPFKCGMQNSPAAGREWDIGNGFQIQGIKGFSSILRFQRVYSL